MKRHASLAHLSRDHHCALVLASHACRHQNDQALSDPVLQRFSTDWTQKIHPHFLEEERVLLPCLRRQGEEALCAQTELEHEQLRQLAAQILAGNTRLFPQWGELMRRHVRFEEASLFARAEQVLTSAQLQDVRTGGA